MVDHARVDVLSLKELTTTNRFVLESYCRAQVQPVYLGDHIAICRLLARYKFYVDTRDRGFGSNVLLDGFWEMWITIFIASIVKPGMVAIDIGANFGYYTLLLGGLVGSEGHVVAVEPNPSTAALLRNSIDLNGFTQRTTLVNAAAGATEGGPPVLLFSPHGEPKNASIIPEPDYVSSASGTIYEVSQTTVDQIVAKIGRVDFLKIDAEGAEEAIINGMTQSLSAHSPAIVLEFNAGRCKDPAALLSKMESIYGKIQYIGFDGAAIIITQSRVLTEKPSEDWLLYFGN